MDSAFERNYMPEPNTGCWLWLGATSEGGYGRWRGTAAHRVSYEHENGRIPDGLCLDHLCRVRSCVNPDHLEPVSNRENVLRGIGVTAANSKKTHCINGHELTPENTRLHARGNGVRRSCKICQRESEMKAYWKRKALGISRPSRSRAAIEARSAAK